MTFVADGETAELVEIHASLAGLSHSCENNTRPDAASLQAAGTLLLFHQRGDRESLRPMFWRRLHRLLPILAIVGLIAGPFTAPVNALTVAAMENVSMSAMAGGEMADDMPCCPGGTPAVPDCQKSCPLMATCMAKCATALPMLSHASMASRTECGALRPASDVMGDALAVTPPARPPRT